MRTYIVTIGLLLIGLVMVPGFALGAFNNVRYPDSVITTVVLTGPEPDITLTISANANVNNIVVGVNTVTVILERDANGNSSITFNSADRYGLGNDGGFTPTCGTNSSTVTLTGPATVGTSTVILAPSAIPCTTSGGSGGGGSPAPAPSPAPSPAPTPTPTPAATPTPAPTPTPTPTTTPAPAPTPPTPTAPAFPTALVPIPAVPQNPTIEQLQAAIAAILQNINFLRAELAKLQQQEAPVPVTTTGPAACKAVTFSRILSLGTSGTDVKCLQSLLNHSTDTMVAQTGAGSPGNETTRFGAGTRSAVIKFQEKNSISATGTVGPLTRTKLNQLLGR